MNFDEEQIKKSNEVLEERLNSDRNDWMNKIHQLISNLKYIDKLAESQVLMLSYRQTLVDKYIEFKNLIYKRNSTWDVNFKNKYRELSVEYDLKLNSSEKAQFTKSYLASLNFQIKLLENHAAYYQESIKTIDNIAFAIKNRIRLEEDL